ncbi:endonuclease-like protein [Virus Rctr85]|nr:endonuclease-like protein [Virus Rctr85]
MHDEMGTVYILRFARPVSGRAKFYIGWTRNLEGRLYYHRKGQGASLTRAAVQQGIDFDVIYSCSGTRALERSLKQKKNTPRLVKKLSLKNGTNV